MRITPVVLVRTAGLAALLFTAACAADLDAGDPSTSELDVVGDQADPTSRAGVPVYFNHAYDLVSQATTDAFQNNAYLVDEFVDVEVRTTVRPDLTYTGTYLNMRATYLEFFPVGTFGYPLGVNGTGLGDEVAGGIDRIAGLWAAEFGADQVSRALRSREINGVQVPWFEEADPRWALLSDYTGLWAMEYVPDAGSSAPRTRLAERSIRYQPNKLARDVDAILFGLPDADRPLLRRSLAAVGWRIADLGADRFAAFSPLDHGTTRAFVVVPSAPDRIGILAILIRLNRFARHREQLGDAVLDVGIGGLPYAVLWIVPPIAADASLLQAQARP